VGANRAIQAFVEAPDGYLYGTTFNGGVGGHYGVFYRISKTGLFQNLHAFCGGNPCTEGTNPQGSLSLGADGYFAQSHKLRSGPDP